MENTETSQSKSSNYGMPSSSITLHINQDELKIVYEALTNHKNKVQDNETYFFSRLYQKVSREIIARSGV